MEITKTFTVTASPNLINRLERFLALLHYNSSFGHSNLFAMHLDGDGSEKIVIKDIGKFLAYEVDAIGGVGYDVEIANTLTYSGKFLDRKRLCRWVVAPGAILYKDGEIH